MVRNKLVTIEDLVEGDLAHNNLLFEVDYVSLKTSAIDRAHQFGWEVVIVDFGNPDSLYALPFQQREEAIDGYSGRKVVFFHDNITSEVDDTVLSFARGHMVWTVWHNSAQNHVFAATFDYVNWEIADRALQNTQFVSPYWSAWNSRPVSKGALDLKPKLDSLEKTTRERGGVLNIFGSGGVGKTTLLFALAARLKAGYNTMELYVGKDAGVAEQARAITEHNKGPILVMDEAGLASLTLQQSLAERYSTIVYASRQPVQSATMHMEIK
jgi:hypothetical protein